MKQRNFEYLLFFIFTTLCILIGLQLVVLYPRNVNILSMNQIGDSYFITLKNNNYRPINGYFKILTDKNVNKIVAFKVEKRDIKRIFIGNQDIGNVLKVIDYDGHEKIFVF